MADFSNNRPLGSGMGFSGDAFPHRFYSQPGADAGWKARMDSVVEWCTKTFGETFTSMKWHHQIGRYEACFEFSRKSYADKFDQRWCR